MSFVLDPSVPFCWFLPCSPDQEVYATGILRRLDSGELGHVPDLWHYEMVSVLWVERRARRINAGTFKAAMDKLTELQAKRLVTGRGFVALPELSNFARRYQLQGYDAVFVYFAQRQGLALATVDRGQKSAAKRLGIPLA